MRAFATNKLVLFYASYKPTINPLVINHSMRKAESRCPCKLKSSPIRLLFFYLGNMKGILSILLISTTLVLYSCNNSVPQDEKDKIEAVLNKQVEGWNSGSIGEYMKGYWNNDSLLFIGRSGPGWGYKNTLERYKRAYPDKGTMGELSFSNLLYRRLSDEYYQVIGQFHLKRDDNDANGHFTLLFKKIEDKWVIVSDHSS